MLGMKQEPRFLGSQANALCIGPRYPLHKGAVASLPPGGSLGGDRRHRYEFSLPGFESQLLLLLCAFGQIISSCCASFLI